MATCCQTIAKQIRRDQVGHKSQSKVYNSWDVDSELNVELVGGVNIPEDRSQL